MPETRRIPSACSSSTSVTPNDFRPTTLRWVLFHLIEVTGRHVGPMDITRELLDGRVGGR